VDRPILRSAFKASKALVMSATVASVSTYQCVGARVAGEPRERVSTTGRCGSSDLMSARDVLESCPDLYACGEPGNPKLQLGINAGR